MTPDAVREAANLVIRWSNLRGVLKAAHEAKTTIFVEVRGGVGWPSVQVNFHQGVIASIEHDIADVEAKLEALGVEVGTI
jgi:hypothetical protein